MSGRLAFPLVSRRRLVGSPFGTQRSARRGRGSETASTRPYLPGDPVATIDWVASARLSAARGVDEFIVREVFAEESPVVAIVLDRRPSMAIYEPTTPWLDKPRAVAIAVRAIVESADAARAGVSLVDDSPKARSLPPARGRVQIALAHVADARYDAPRSALDDAVHALARRRRTLPAGSFVFIVSDFLGTLEDASRARLRGLGCDIVPVIVQDPTWERTFPDVSGVLLPIVDVETGAVRSIRITRREALARRQAHEERYHELVTRFRIAGMDSVTLSDTRPERIHREFLAWADRRRRVLRRLP